MAYGERWENVVSFGLLAYDFDSRMCNGVYLGPMAVHEGFCFCAAGVVLGLTATGGWCFEECFVALKTDDESCCLPCCLCGSRTGEGCCSSDPWFLDGLKAHDEGCCSWAAEGLLGRVWNGIHVKTQQALPLWFACGISSKSELGTWCCSVKCVYLRQRQQHPRFGTGVLSIPSLVTCSSGAG